MAKIKLPENTEKNNYEWNESSTKIHLAFKY